MNCFSELKGICSLKLCGLQPRRKQEEHIFSVQNLYRSQREILGYETGDADH